MADNQKPQLLSGARGKLQINGKEIAFITDVSISFNVNVRPVHTFGSINARSVEPLQAGPVQITIGRVIPMNNGTGDYKDTSNTALAIEPVLNQMTQADDIYITLLDRVTGKTVANIRNCRFAGSSKQLAASQLASERLTLMGIYDAGPNNQNVAKTGILS